MNITNVMHNNSEFNTIFPAVGGDNIALTALTLPCPALPSTSLQSLSLLSLNSST